MTKLYNLSKFKQFRKELRTNMTEPEKKLWVKLRRKQFLGLRFHRQFSVGKYILDFYCPEKRIAIEIDGSQHLNVEIKINDAERTRFLESLNIKVLRFQNHEVNNLQSVLDTIERELTPSSASQTLPL